MTHSAALTNWISLGILRQSYYVRRTRHQSLDCIQFQQVYHHSNPITRAASFGSTKWKFNIRSANHSLFFFFFMYSKFRAWGGAKENFSLRLSKSRELRNLSLEHINKKYYARASYAILFVFPAPCGIKQQQTKKGHQRADTFPPSQILFSCWWKKSICVRTQSLFQPLRCFIYYWIFERR